MEPMYVSSAPNAAIRRSSVNACERKSGEGQLIGTNTVLGGHFSFIIFSRNMPTSRNMCTDKQKYSVLVCS